jgi:site-specific DNA-methyltransferase (adenine-specific)
MKLDREKIVYKKVDDLKLNPKNPRKNDDAVSVVAKSIEKYGFKNPLIIDENNIVWCGNTRLKASRTLGLEEVPCIVASDLTEEQIRELALIDNKSSEIAEWDFDLLGDELAELNMTYFDLDWNLVDNEIKEIERKDLSETIKSQFELIVNCEDEQILEQLYNEMIERGYECKISTL